MILYRCRPRMCVVWNRIDDPGESFLTNEMIKIGKH
jgi:hypothetical protein